MSGGGYSRMADHLVLRHDDSVFDYNNCIGWGEFSHASNLVSTKSASAIKVWDAHTGRCLSTGARHAFCEHRITCSHNGNGLIVRYLTDTVTFQDPFTRACVVILHDTNRVIEHFVCCDLSADGLHVAIGSRSTIRFVDHYIITIWDARANICVRTVRMPTEIRDCVYSLDGTLLVVILTNQIIKVWNPADGTCLCVIRDQNHNRAVDYALSPRDAALLATAFIDDPTIKLWDARTGVCLNTLVGHDVPTETCRFSRDGVYLVTTSIDNTIRIWKVYGGVCVHVIPRTLTPKFCDISYDNSLLVIGHSLSPTVCISQLPFGFPTNMLLLIILGGYRDGRLWLPSELWNELHDLIIESF